MKKTISIKKLMQDKRRIMILLKLGLLAFKKNQYN